MAEKTRLNISLSSDMREWLEAESKRLGIPMSSLVIMALNTYITQQKTVQLTDYLRSNDYLPASVVL